MVKFSVLWSFVYLAVSNYPDGGFFPSFFLFFFPPFFSFYIHVVTPAIHRVCGRHSNALQEDAFASQGGANLC